MSTKNKVVSKHMETKRVMDYCDTIVVMLSKPEYTERLDYKQLKSIKDYIECRSGSVVYNPRNKLYLPQFTWFLSIHQPTRESVRRLIEITNLKLIEVRLIQVHFARDYVFESLEDAEKWGEFIKQHIVKKWRGKQKLGGYEDVTFYTSKKRMVPLNIVVYFDKRNRFTNEPNVHVEFRISGSDKLKSINISNLEDVCQVDQEITSYIDKNLILRDLGKRAQKRIRDKCHGLNSSYTIGDKEFPYRWLPRLIGVFKRYGIQALIDTLSNERADERLTNIQTNNERAFVSKEDEDGIKDIIDLDQESIDIDQESNMESVVESNNTKINIFRYLDVVELEYSLPSSASDENEQISRSRSGLIMAGTEPSINELEKKSHVSGYNHKERSMLAVKQFLNELGWSEAKQDLFMNFDQLPAEYLDDNVLILWKELKSDLNFFTKVCRSYQAVADNLLKQCRDVNFEAVDEVLERFLRRDHETSVTCNQLGPATEPASIRMRPVNASSSGRAQPDIDTKRFLSRESVMKVRPANKSASGRVQPSKLTSEEIIKIYQLATSGQNKISTIAGEFHISRKAVQLIRGKIIHRDILIHE